MRSHRYANPADDPEAHPFLKAIASSNGNSLPRMVFADWLDENGYTNAAAGQRWAAKHGKQPLIGEDTERGNGLRGWHMGGRHPDPHELSSELPRPFFFHDSGSTTLWAGNHPKYNGGELYATGFRHSPVDPPHYERVYLGRTHEMNWHPETGEPLPPQAP